MNYYEHFKNSKGNRDTVFQDVLNRLGGKSAAILEVGCSRNLSPGSRQGDGWSSFHFLEHVDKHGHLLHICDIEAEALYNCRKLIDTYPKTVDVSLHKHTGYIMINSGLDYDLYYLDGGDDPAEMVDEYEAILKLTNPIKTNAENKYNPLVLCDDFHAKGSLLRQKYPNFLLYKWENNEHEMALYGAETGIKLLKPIQ